MVQIKNSNLCFETKHLSFYKNLISNFKKTFEKFWWNPAKITFTIFFALISYCSTSLLSLSSIDLILSTVLCIFSQNHFLF